MHIGRMQICFSAFRSGAVFFLFGTAFPFMNMPEPSACIRINLINTFEGFPILLINFWKLCSVERFVFCHDNVTRDCTQHRIVVWFCNRSTVYRANA